MKVPKCYRCGIELNEDNWYEGDRLFKPQPRYRCKLCSQVVKLHSRGVDSNFEAGDYNKMFEEQSGCCYLCDKHQSEQKYRLGIDHSHQTGKVRGLLCNACNTKLAWFENRKEKILKYLETE